MLHRRLYHRIRPRRRLFHNHEYLTTTGLSSKTRTVFLAELTPICGWQIQDHPMIGDWMLAPFCGNPGKPELEKNTGGVPDNGFAAEGRRVQLSNSTFKDII